MPFSGSIIPPSSFGPVPGGPGGDRRVQRKRAAGKTVEAGSSFQRALDDEASLTSIESMETSRPVAGPSSNESEEGHEDRAEHGAYADLPKAPARPRIDVQG